MPAMRRRAMRAITFPRLVGLRTERPHTHSQHPRPRAPGERCTRPQRAGIRPHEGKSMRATTTALVPVALSPSRSAYDHGSRVDNENVRHPLHGHPPRRVALLGEPLPSRVEPRGPIAALLETDRGAEGKKFVDRCVGLDFFY